jgi:hypothetical protein
MSPSRLTPRLTEVQAGRLLPPLESHNRQLREPEHVNEKMNKPRAARAPKENRMRVIYQPKC